MEACRARTIALRCEADSAIKEEAGKHGQQVKRGPVA